LSATSIIGILWLVWIVYWVASAAGAKKSIRDTLWRRGVVIRLVLVVGLIWFLRSPGARQFVVRDGPFPANRLVSSAGVLLCALGLGFTVWARVHLGRNWGMPMTVREDPELVASGPYSLVRHPIYSGILAAMLGSSLVDGRFWPFVFIGCAAYFIYSATTEEKLMTQQFPNRYTDYKKRTKMLIPFVF
jgi:protein-S-isoprenylcysteine O-methyltransferase Ste14